MADSTPSATGHTWAVTGQEEEPTIDAQGNKTTMHHVHFQTSDGTQSHISLPDHQYSAANVHAQITHKAKQIHAVSKLTSQSPAPTE